MQGVVFCFTQLKRVHAWIALFFAQHVHDDAVDETLVWLVRTDAGDVEEALWRVRRAACEDNNQSR